MKKRLPLTRKQRRALKKKIGYMPQQEQFPIRQDTNGSYFHENGKTFKPVYNRHVSKADKAELKRARKKMDQAEEVEV